MYQLPDCLMDSANIDLNYGVEPTADEDERHERSERSERKLGRSGSLYGIWPWWTVEAAAELLANFRTY